MRKLRFTEDDIINISVNWEYVTIKDRLLGNKRIPFNYLTNQERDLINEVLAKRYIKKTRRVI